MPWTANAAACTVTISLAAMIANLLTAAGELDAGRAAIEVPRELDPTPDHRPILCSWRGRGPMAR